MAAHDLASLPALPDPAGELGYFKVELIKSEHLRRLVELAQGRWGDEAG